MHARLFWRFAALNWQSGLRMRKLELSETLDSTEIRAELECVIASPEFSKSSQLARFIRFVVEETLAGRGDRIKAYTIAADAFGRDANFNPQNDPIVRVEAGRLRRALAHYYSNGGRDDPVVIELPRGGYMPVFRVHRVPLPAIARMHWLRRRADVLRENYRLVLLMVVVAIVVSLTLDLLGGLFVKLVWPASGSALQSHSRREIRTPTQDQQRNTLIPTENGLAGGELALMVCRS
jgi:hypothetical protein